MGSRLDRVSDNISSFRRKYYLNLFLRGSILTLTLLLGYFLLASLLEYNLWLGKEVRFALFVLFFLTASYCVYRYLRDPLLWWLSGKGLGKEESARIIGDHFPAIQDRLLNFLQLATTTRHRGPLLEASLEQKATLFAGFTFDSIIDLRENRRYLKYLAIPFIAFALIALVNQKIITQSAERIVNFDQEYTPQAPFRFYIDHEKLVAFPNEDFELNIHLEGEALPDAAYLVIGRQRLKLVEKKAGSFFYLFEKPQQDISFQVEAAGFYSDTYVLRIVNRPELMALNVQLSFPRYIGRPTQVLQNIGNLEVPEGTRVTWTLATANTRNASIFFSSEQAPKPMQSVDDQSFTYGKGFSNPDGYSISLVNENSSNKDQISYQVDVIKDQYPTLTVDQLRDSALFQTILLAGMIKDDYGITRLALQYQLTRQGAKEISSTIPLEISSSPQQNFFYRWNLDSLHLNGGDRLQYYIEVWDNDGVHGHKSTRSVVYQFERPGDEAFKSEIKRSQSTAEREMERSISKAKSLKESIEEAEQRLKGKQSLDWQDRKMLEDLIEQKKSLDKMIEDLQQQNKMLEEKKNAYSEQNESIREKSEQIQKLMNELLDDEMKKLFQELEKMLRENQDPSQIQKMLDKMDRQEINLEKELERTLELFKSLQYDYKLDQAIQDLAKQIEEQKDLLEQTQELAGEKPEGATEKKEGDKDAKEGEMQPKSAEELAKDQEELTKKSEGLEKSLEELNKLGEELDKPANAPGPQEMDEVQELQKQSKESLEQKSPSKATAPQKKSVEQMKKMKERLEGMQNSMEMEIDQQNLESLRQIIHGLIKLSFDQESLIKDFSGVQQSDPAYVQLSQNQLKIKDDSKVLEDSLLALAKKDPFMGSIVTREIGELNDHLDKASVNIKERKKSNASADMQLSMTSMNNLALMLNDHFEMMMQMMQNAMPSMSKGKKQKGKKSLSEMQMQLNQQMEEIKKSGKGGRQLSEEMAKMAAEQERIRRALQEMQDKMKQEGGQPFGNDLPAKMEQTEIDLVNKQLTEQTLRRQKEIITRLLESEKSMREQELDEERKGETAKDYQKEIPKAFEDYLRLKEKEVELLKTVPPKLYPYYKNEVNQYFKRLGNQK
ncbi:MAG: DUF4175 family protein [Cyclobacteriaceae bacterium]|nr:DUF4175 family protein [Cyclobacteriaceae bacterium]